MARRYNSLDQLLNPGKQAQKEWKQDRTVRVKKSNEAAAKGIPSVDRIGLTYDDAKFNKSKISSKRGVTKEWERSELKPLHKGYGRSMDKKFTKWAEEQGVPKNQHFQFRKWMDANESKVKSSGYNAVEGRTETLEKEAMTKRANEKRRASEQKEIKAEKTAVKAKKSNGGVFGFLSKIDKSFNNKTEGSKVDRVINRSFNSMGGNSNQEMMKGLIKEGPRPGREKEYEKMVKQYEDRFGGKTSVLDMAADLSGYLLPGAAAYKGTKALGLGAKGLTKGVSLRNAGQLAKEGAVAGGILGGAEVGIREGINPNDYNYKDNLKHLGINVAAGALLDPALSMAGPAISQLAKGSASKALAKSTAKQLDDVLRSGDYESLSKFMKQDPKPTTTARDILSGKVEPPTDIQNPLRQAQPLEPRVSQSQALRELTNAPKRATMQPRGRALDPDAPFTSKLEYWKDKKNPINEQDVIEIRKKAEELHGELEAFKENVPRLREVELAKRPALKSQLDELRAKVTSEVQAKSEWETVKEMQDMYKLKQNRPEWMNISDTLSDDFRDIPTRFRSSDSPIDPYMAMENAGFDNMEEFIGHLQNIDSKLRVRLKDLQQDTTANSNQAYKQLEQLETQIDKKLYESYGIDELESSFNELIPLGQVREGAIDPLEGLRTLVMSKGKTQNKEMPLRSDPYAEGMDDSLIDSLIAKKPMKKQGPLGVTSTAVKPYEATPFATQKGKIESNIEKNGTLKERAAKVRAELDSDVYPVKQMEKELVAKYGDELGKMLPDGTLARESSIAKNIQMLPYTEARAIKSYEKGDAPRQLLLKKSNITNEIADQYNLAKHAIDIHENESVKLDQLIELKYQRDLIEESRLLNTDTAAIKAMDAQEQKILKAIAKLEPYELPEMASEEWARGIIKNLEGVSGIAEQQKMYVREQAKTLRMVQEAGHITERTVSDLMEKYPNYVPLNREMLDAVGKPATRGGANAKNPMKQRKRGSSKLEIVNLRESALKNRITAMKAIDRSRIFTNIGKFADKPEMRELFKRVSPEDPNFKHMADKMISGPDGKGGEIHYVVPPYLKAALEFQPKEFSMVLDWVGKSTQLFKSLTTTYNPQFHIKALLRDTPQMAATSKTNAHIGHMAMGFLDSFGGKSLSKLRGGKYKSYQQAFDDLGGDYSTFISQDKASVQKYLKTLEKGSLDGMKVFNPFKQIENFGKKSEQVARLGEFRSAKNKGYSDEDAFFEAINLLDYKDQGSLTRSINKVSPYFSPTMRGNIRTLEAMKTPHFWATGAVAISVPTVLNYMAKQSSATSDLQRAKIDNLPTWAKNTMWAYPIPNSEKVILYPKPFILGQMFANPIERVLDKVYEDTERPVKEIAKETGLDAFQTLVPSISIAGLSGVWQMQANQRFFTGMPIEDMKMLAEPDKTERYNVYTSEVAKKAGKVTGQSPAMIDSILKGQLGTMGTKTLDVSDNVIAKYGDRPAKVNTSGSILNPLGNYAYKDSSASGLYERVLKQTQWDDKEQKKNGRRKKGYTRTKSQEVLEYLKETNKEVAGIRESTTLTSKEKTEQISEIRNAQKLKASEVLVKRNK